MMNFLNNLNNVVWTNMILPCVLLCGIILSVKTGFAQIRLLPASIKQVFKHEDENGGITSYEASATALGATIGTGNIVGTVQAMCMGGVGAVFWMWVAAILAMIIKYAEIFCSLKHRKQGRGEGPIGCIEKTLGTTSAKIYSAAIIGADIGMGCMAQMNGCISAIKPLQSTDNIKLNILIAGIFAIAVTAIMRGKAKSVGKAASKLVPFMSGIFAFACVSVLVCRARYIIPAFNAILSSALDSKSMLPGIVWGLRRGILSNEAGLGSSALAHCSVENAMPEKEALWGIIEVFADTVIICTLVALTVLCGGVELPMGTLPGTEVMVTALSSVFNERISELYIFAAMLLFALTSMLGWGVYAQKGAAYLFGEKGERMIAYIPAAAILLGAIISTELAWGLSDIFNAFMILPNMTAVMLLSRKGLHNSKYADKKGLR